MRHNKIVEEGLFAVVIIMQLIAGIAFITGSFLPDDSITRCLLGSGYILIAIAFILAYLLSKIAR